MKWLFRAATVLIALVIAPAPAVAAEEKPGPVLEPVTTWPTLLCPAGVLERTAASAGAAGIHVDLEGYLDCARPANLDAYFGFATYDGAVYGTLTTSNTWRYETTPPSRFSRSVFVPFTRVPEVGVCVVTERQTRVGCVKAAYDGQAVTLTSLAADDPLVDREVVVIRDSADTWPTCGTCF